MIHSLMITSLSMLIATICAMWFGGSTDALFCTATHPSPRPSLRSISFQWPGAPSVGGSLVVVALG
jgi:hypothetical protein